MSNISAQNVARLSRPLRLIIFYYHLIGYLRLGPSRCARKCRIVLSLITRFTCRLGMMAIHCVSRWTRHYTELHLSQTFLSKTKRLTTWSKLMYPAHVLTFLSLKTSLSRTSFFFLLRTLMTWSLAVIILRVHYEAICARFTWIVDWITYPITITIVCLANNTRVSILRSL